MTEYSFYNCIRYRRQTKYLTSAKFVTYYYLSDILLGREKEQRLAITFWMCFV